MGTCKITGCGGMTAKDEHPLCAGHWKKVPSRIRGELYAAMRKKSMGRPVTAEEYDSLVERVVREAGA